MEVTRRRWGGAKGVGAGEMLGVDFRRVGWSQQNIGSSEDGVARGLMGDSVWVCRWSVV